MGVPERGGNERGVARRWVLAAAFVLLVGVVHPEGGTRAVCPSRVLFEVPCGLCGVTRSVSAACRGHAAEAWGLHPLGIPAVVIALVVLAAWVLPRRVSAPAIGWWRAHPGARVAAGAAVLGVIVALGVARWVGRGGA